MTRDSVFASPRLTSKGIFCLEGDWWGKIHKSSTVEPILELLKEWDPYFVNYVRRDVATRSEFEYYVGKWSQKQFASYPILYLAFHGSQSEVSIGDKRVAENRVSIAELSELLEGKCHGRMIYFGSCNTLDLHGHSINAFLRRTDAIAVCGYRRDVEWLEATAFELIVFSAMQIHAMTRQGAAAMERRIYRHAPELARKLRFHMVINKG